MQKANGGRGVLPGKVTVLGCGIVGLHAARMAAGPWRRCHHHRPLGPAPAPTRRPVRRPCSYPLLGRRGAGRRKLLGPHRVVLNPGAAAPKLVTRETLSGMKKGSVLVDVAIEVHWSPLWR
nr:hypothetical protein [Mesorhizobium amorphae]